MPENSELLRVLDTEIVACRKCPRLVAYREKVAREKRLAYRDCTYWGKPVPGFGDARAQLLIVGLAPGAHGSNRTGRMFTGDRSGVFLYQALYDAGFANQPAAVNRDDGLRLKNAYITAAARCAPPENKPLPSEILNCRGYLEREIDILQPRAVLALGKIAWDVFLGILKHRGAIPRRCTRRCCGASGDFSDKRQDLTQRSLRSQNAQRKSRKQSRRDAEGAELRRVEVSGMDGSAGGVG